MIDRKALIVANDEYVQPELSRLRSPAKDAELLVQVLGNPQIGGFDVQTVRNEESHMIEGRIEDFFADCRPGDLLLLHFSCHGIKNDAGELFFTARNTRPSRLHSTAIHADFIHRCMRESRASSVVLLLDCCYGGAFTQGASIRAAGNIHVLDSFPQERLRGRGRAVITACNSMEFAFDGDVVADLGEPRPSVFTGALVQGLITGEADSDQDGWVALDELYEYVFDKVREVNPNQTPSRKFDLQGDLYLARSARRQIRSSAIPADLRDAISSPDQYARLGAVGELQSRMSSRDLAAARAAVDALAEVAAAGIKPLAQFARESLAKAAPQVDPAHLNFDVIRQGSDSPRKSLRLLGPPVAQACSVRPADHRIQARITFDELEVWIETSEPGLLDSELKLTSPVGDATVRVRARIVSRIDQPLQGASDRLSDEEPPDRNSDVPGPPPPRRPFEHRLFDPPPTARAEDSATSMQGPPSPSPASDARMALILAIASIPTLCIAALPGAFLAVSSLRHSRRATRNARQRGEAPPPVAISRRIAIVILCLSAVLVPLALSPSS